ncbi:hypothetical protein D3C71_1253400 [compost metagenome]
MSLSTFSWVARNSPLAISTPPRTLAMSISGCCAWVMRKPSMMIVSAWIASGISICGSESGQVGSSNGSSLLARFSVAFLICSASSCSLRPSSGRMSGSR